MVRDQLREPRQTERRFVAICAGYGIKHSLFAGDASCGSNTAAAGRCRNETVDGVGLCAFTDRNWLGQGMVTELVNAALENTPHPVPYAITWDDNWSTHLFPQLDGKKFDMGFHGCVPTAKKIVKTNAARISTFPIHWWNC